MSPRRAIRISLPRKPRVVPQAIEQPVPVERAAPLAECEELLNFMLEPSVAIAVAEGQNYPPSLDPTKVPLSDKVKNLPAFDATGTLKSLTFADPAYWAPRFDDWEKQWDRIAKGA